MPSIWPFEVTPKNLEHEAVQRLTAKIGRKSVPLKVQRGPSPMPLGNCYWNVAHAVENYGGKLVLGWAIMWWPNLYATAMHHAIWRDTEGNIKDVTEPQQYDKGCPYTAFKVDDSLPVDLERLPCIDNIIEVISPSQTLTEKIDRYMESQAIRREIAEIFWDNGYRCEDQFAKAAGGLAKSIEMDDATVERVKLLERRKYAVGGKLGAAINTLMGTGAHRG